MKRRVKRRATQRPKLRLKWSVGMFDSSNRVALIGTFKIDIASITVMRGVGVWMWNISTHLSDFGADEKTRHAAQYAAELAAEQLLHDTLVLAFKRRRR
jgi:hypothetical protein